MEKKSILLIIFFTSVVIVSLAGFFNSYIRFFPHFDHFPGIIHLHFAAFVCWFAMIIVQPVLIRQKKHALHRHIGKCSYFLAPVLVITILVLLRNQVQREMADSAANAAMIALIGLLDALSFSVYYLIAMINKRNLRWHVAFLIAATLIVLNPGMARLLNHLQPGLGLPAAIIFPFLVPAAILIFERIRFKRPVLKSPYFLFFCCWALEIILFMTLPGTALWKNWMVYLTRHFTSFSPTPLPGH